MSGLIPRTERGSYTSGENPLLTRVELYAALQAARAELPRDPEAFRLWLHRARKQGLVTKFRASRSKAAPGFDTQ
jgi:hypothetical protein